MIADAEPYWLACDRDGCVAAFHAENGTRDAVPPGFPAIWSLAADLASDAAAPFREVLVTRGVGVTPGGHVSPIDHLDLNPSCSRICVLNIADIADGRETGAEPLLRRPGVAETAELSLDPVLPRSVPVPWSTPKFDPEMYAYALAGVRSALTDGRARIWTTFGGRTVLYLRIGSDQSSGDLCRSGLCAGCRLIDGFDESRRLCLEAQFGRACFRFRTEEWAPPLSLYELEEPPGFGASLEEFPEPIRLRIQGVRFERLCFREAERIQPLEHFAWDTGHYRQYSRSSDRRRSAVAELERRPRNRGRA
jgi:hypothetical protein